MGVRLDNKSMGNNKRRARRSKYKRKREKPSTEKELDRLRRMRQAKFEKIQKEEPTIFKFDSLFPEPVWDEEMIHKDLFEVSERDESVGRQVQLSPDKRQEKADASRDHAKVRSSSIGGSSMMRVWRDQKLSETMSSSKPIMQENNAVLNKTASATVTVDPTLTRMVEDKVYGYRRSLNGNYEYDTSLMGDGAVQFRDGVRLGKALRINADRLNYHAKKELQHGRIEEAQELYEKAIEIDPTDGRAYLGLSRVAERRRDFKLARQCLTAGISKSVSFFDDQTMDRGPNPFLLQALGCLEEKAGHVSEAEALYISAARSRPSHAAAWVALAQLRTRKLRQSAAAGRVCFQTAERELKKAGKPPSSHVYTAWASLEYKKAGDVRRARELFQKALKVDKKCSPAWLQLGVMEADNENWTKAQECFETVLKFDQRNSRVLQAYAIMETKRPEGDDRKAIGLFERALKANPRDAGVLQAYALFVAKLGDVEAARNLLRAGTEVNKRHAPVWQAWGVMETRHGDADEARKIFQQGIWACAQLAGGQSGGYKCARLWQGWGVLEAQEGDHAAARRCFSRALDADNRNVAAVTAWTLMEEELGNYQDARAIFERVLNQFPAASHEKMAIWRAYELMEQHAGNKRAALQVYQRSMGETMVAQEEYTSDEGLDNVPVEEPILQSMDEVLTQSKEVEVERWNAGRGEVWMNNGNIESKVPTSRMKSRSKNNKKTTPQA